MISLNLKILYNLVKYFIPKLVLYVVRLQARLAAELVSYLSNSIMRSLATYTIACNIWVRVLSRGLGFSHVGFLTWVISRGFSH